MAEEIQEAVQIIRVAYDGIEIAMKVGSGGIAAMQKAIDFLKAVSYTHLDVYKRQLYWFPEGIGNPASGIIPSVYHILR